VRFLFVLCAGFGLGAIVCLLQYVLISQDRFRRNPFLGIATPETRESEETWRRAHVAAAPWIGRAGVAAAASSALAFAGGAIGGGVAAIPFAIASGTAGVGVAGFFMLRASGAARRAALLCDEAPMVEEGQMYPCPCCGYRTLGEPPGSFEICAVCEWEDDSVQLRYPKLAGGANRESLIDAQIAFHSHRASAGRSVRSSEPCESRALDAGWRTLDPGRDDFEAFPSQEPWPDDLTRLYWWRATYWRRAAEGRDHRPATA
jgi:hypothetical protein